MAVRTARNISLTPELERFVTSQVASGRYKSASEVVRDALRLLEQRRLEDASLNKPPPASPSSAGPGRGEL